MAKKLKLRPDGRYQIKRIVDGKAKFFYGATYDEAEASAWAAGQHNITQNDTFAIGIKYWLKTSSTQFAGKNCLNNTTRTKYCPRNRGWQCSV